MVETAKRDAHMARSRAAKSSITGERLPFGVGKTPGSGRPVRRG